MNLFGFAGALVPIILTLFLVNKKQVARMDTVAAVVIMPIVLKFPDLFIAVSVREEYEFV